MMRRAPKIKVTLVRPGMDPETVELPKESTVRELLDETNVELETGEAVWVGGERASKSDVLESNDIVNVIASKEGGTD